MIVDHFGFKIDLGVFKMAPARARLPARYPDPVVSG
jgi:hypothetical protein